MRDLTRDKPHLDAGRRTLEQFLEGAGVVGGITACEVGRRAAWNTHIGRVTDGLHHLPGAHIKEMKGPQRRGLVPSFRTVDHEGTLVMSMPLSAWAMVSAASSENAPTTWNGGRAGLDNGPSTLKTVRTPMARRIGMMCFIAGW